MNDEAPLVHSAAGSDVTYNSHDTGSNSGSYGYEDAISFTGYGLFHILLLFLCGWAVSSDAIEVLSISFILPSAEIELGLTSEEQGLLNAIIFAGMMFGGYLWGSLADKLGRRSVLLGSLTVNGIGGLISSLSQPFWLFLLMRFISGIGVGGSIPVVFSYFAEFQPKLKRGAMISVLATFWMGGNIIAAGLAWIIIPHTELGPYSKDGFKFDSWRIFICVCTIPSLTSAFMFLWMPESPKFLLQTGKEDKAVNVLRTIHRLNSPKTNPIFMIKSVYLYDGDDKDKPIRHSASQEGCWPKFVQSLKMLSSNTKRIFRRDLRLNSVIMIIINFTLAFGYYGLFMWFPKLFARVEKFGGTPCNLGSNNASVIISNITTTTLSPDYPPPAPSQWVFFSGFMTASSNLPGNILTIFLMDRIGRKPLLIISMVICALSVFAIIFVQDKVQNLVLSCVFGGVSTAGWNTLDVLGAELFPTSVRSTAFGVQQVFNRIGAILGNIVFGELLDVSCYIPLIMVAVFLIIGALSAIPLPNTTKKDIH